MISQRQWALRQNGATRERAGKPRTRRLHNRLHNSTPRNALLGGRDAWIMRSSGRAGGTA